MPPLRPSAAQLFSPILYLALAEPVGLLLDSGGDYERAVARLYKARQLLADPELAGLQIRRSGSLEGGDLVVVNRKLISGKRSLLKEEEEE